MTQTEVSEVQKAGRRRAVPILGFIIALVITGVAPVALSNLVLNALLLFPLVLIFIYLSKLKTDEWGLRWGKTGDYLLAIVYPISLAIVIALLAALTGNIGIVTANFALVGKTVYLFFITLVLAFTMEEGFFRGWMYAAMEKLDSLQEVS
jgi:membrane protease YdiL (CAAX protease family)